MTPAIIALLLGCMVGATDSSYHEQALKQIRAEPERSVTDLRRTPRLDPAGQALLLAVTREFAAQGHRLRFVLVDAGPQFSLGDFTTEIARTIPMGLHDVLIVATSAGLHAQAPWLSYRDARQLALQHQPAYQQHPAKALRSFAADISKEGLRRSRHRDSMVALAGLAVAAIFFILFRATLRRRRLSRPDSGTTASL